MNIPIYTTLLYEFTYLFPFSLFLISVIRDRDLDYNITSNDILADGIIYGEKKDQLEVTIGEGMEFTIHGNNIFVFQELTMRNW